MGKLTVRRGVDHAATTAITTAIVLVALFPILWAVLNSFKELMDIVTPVPRFIFSPTLANYQQVLGDKYHELEHSSGHLFSSRHYDLRQVDEEGRAPIIFGGPAQMKRAAAAAATAR